VKLHIPILALLLPFMFMGNAYADTEPPNLGASDNQCRATYALDEGTLHVPCVKVLNPAEEPQFYAAELQQIPDTEPLQFSVMPTAESNEENQDDSCVATYSVESGEVYIPCVDMVNSSGEVESDSLMFKTISADSFSLVQLVLDITSLDISEKDSSLRRSSRRHNNSYVRAIGGSCPPGPESGRPDSEVYKADKWRFFKCECTSYVAWKLNNDGIKFRNRYKKVHFSNAKTWKSAAQRLSIRVDRNPRKGDIAWWGYSRNQPNGHVAYVESVNSNGTVNISEYNYGKPGHQYNTRTIRRNDADGYIHIQNKPVQSKPVVSGYALDGKDPNATGCDRDGKTVSSKYTSYGKVELRWSNACKTNWTRVRAYSSRYNTSAYLWRSSDRKQQIKYGKGTIWTPMFYAPNIKACAYGIVKGKGSGWTCR